MRPTGVFMPAALERYRVKLRWLDPLLGLTKDVETMKQPSRWIRLLPAAVLTTFSGLTLSALGQGANRLPAELIYRDWLKPPFKWAGVEKGTGAVRELPDVDPALRDSAKSTIEDAKGLVERHDVLGLLLLERDGSVLFEAYKQGAAATDRLIGYSLSKSATSVAIGQALCDGLLASMDAPAERHADALKGTAYGAATIKELLTMSSTGKVPEAAGQPVAGWTTALLRTQSRTILEGLVEYGSVGKDASKRGQFEYKNLDAYALGLAGAGASKQPFHNYFAKAVWQKIGAESDAAWLIDRNGDTATAEGFGARLRDWGRFALYVRDAVKAEDGQSTCLSRYLKDATATQISNDSLRISKDFRGYGYMFWTENWMTKEPSFWMTGFGGQRIGVDLKSGRTLVLISNAEDFMPAVYRVFDTWTRQ